MSFYAGITQHYLLQGVQNNNVFSMQFLILSLELFLVIVHPFFFVQVRDFF